jgi:hypothetical protein
MGALQQEVWSKLPLNELQRQDMFNNLIAEMDQSSEESKYMKGVSKEELKVIWSSAKQSSEKLVGETKRVGIQMLALLVGLLRDMVQTCMCLVEITFFL